MKDIKETNFPKEVKDMSNEKNKMQFVCDRIQDLYEEAETRYYDEYTSEEEKEKAYRELEAYSNAIGIIEMYGF